MALPTLSKTWIFKTNQYIPAAATVAATFQNILFNLKSCLTTASGWTDSTGAATTNPYPWTVTSSSDGTTADLTDRWGSTANLVSGSNFSWIVLRQARISPLFEISFGFSTSSTYYAHYFYVSHGLGFAQTGLVTTAYPASLGDRYLLDNGSPLDGQTAVHDVTLHYMMSTDGECTRVIGCYSNNTTLFWILDKAKNPVSGWTNPAVALSIRTDPVYSQLNSAANVVGISPGGVAMPLHCSTEGYGTKPVCQNILQPNSITGEWAITPIGLVSNTVGTRGRHGELFDIWFTSPNFYLGESCPSTGNRQFIAVPYLVLPWNRSDMLTQ